jgi:hypothetical protein
MTLGADRRRLPLDDLTRALGSLALGDELRAEKVLRTGVSATKFSVREAPLNQEPEPRTRHEPGREAARALAPAEDLTMIDGSSLAPAGAPR